MTVDELLQKIRDRKGRKNAIWEGGIRTASEWVSTIAACVDDEACSAKMLGDFTPGQWEEAIKQSEQKLTYSNDEMLVDEQHVKAGGNLDQWVKDCLDRHGVKAEEVEKVKAPKGTIMVVENIVTTAKKDRDGDILETGGAKVDPKMPLLWQHNPMQPIGKMLAVLDHTKSRLKVLTALVDCCDLSNDAAKMIEADMMRISHGFRPLKFEPIKSDEAGFRVQEFEVMEESLVSVPANTDAIITMASRGKFHSPWVKSWAERLRKEGRPTTVSIPAKIVGDRVELDLDQIDKSLVEKIRGKNSCGCGNDKTAERVERLLSDFSDKFEKRIAAMGETIVKRLNRNQQEHVKAAYDEAVEIKGDSDFLPKYRSKARGIAEDLEKMLPSQDDDGKFVYPEEKALTKGDAEKIKNAIGQAEDMKSGSDANDRLKRKAGNIVRELKTVMPDSDDDGKGSEPVSLEAAMETICEVAFSDEFAKHAEKLENLHGVLGNALDDHKARMAE